MVWGVKKKKKEGGGGGEDCNPHNTPLDPPRIMYALKSEGVSENQKLYKYTYGVGGCECVTTS